eukprot:TRINITY_DN14322_c0_g3_i1.p1 TRINITY_DN14322_c0_g3~~TRINITY_DN14322_c0_g3_i1.p1  ORF type:complete len:652 (+),score=160.26 TRINITY_DN14322_c0_g3_i1:63-2018(+)
MLGLSAAPGEGKCHIVPIAAWERAEELVAMDPLRFRDAHKKLYAHRQRVEAVKGTYGLDTVERESAETRARSEAMRQSKLKHQEQANLELQKENQRLVERLCTVMRESEIRQKQMLSPRAPSTAPAAQGTLNLGSRRKNARRIDQDNRALLSRLIRVAPRTGTRGELAARYKAHSDLVHRHTRLRRTVDQADIMLTPPPRAMQPGPRRPTPPWKKPAPSPQRSHRLQPLANSASTNEALELSENDDLSSTVPAQTSSSALNTGASAASLSKENSASDAPEAGADRDQAETPENVREARQVARDEVDKACVKVVERMRSEPSLLLEVAPEPDPKKSDEQNQGVSDEADKKPEESKELEEPKVLAEPEKPGKPEDPKPTTLTLEEVGNDLISDEDKVEAPSYAADKPLTNSPGSKNKKEGEYDAEYDGDIYEAEDEYEGDDGFEEDDQDDDENESVMSPLTASASPSKQRVLNDFSETEDEHSQSEREQEARLPAKVAELPTAAPSSVTVDELKKDSVQEDISSRLSSEEKRQQPGEDDDFEFDDFEEDEDPEQDYEDFEKTGSSFHDESATETTRKGTAGTTAGTRSGTAGTGMGSSHGLQGRGEDSFISDSEELPMAETSPAGKSGKDKNAETIDNYDDDEDWFEEDSGSH